jgi:hypothetical protein
LDEVCLKRARAQNVDVFFIGSYLLSEYSTRWIFHNIFFPQVEKSSPDPEEQGFLTYQLSRTEYNCDWIPQVLETIYMGSMGMRSMNLKSLGMRGAFQM